MQEHFSKFTDNTGEMIWVKDDAGKDTGTSAGCKATDGEQFNYVEPYTCEGAVEDWLLSLMAHQADSHRVKLLDAINVFVEVTRDKWLDMFLAQATVVTTQTWWTTEVNTAFDRLEQGNENALKEYLAQCINGLVTYANLVLGDLNKEKRIKVKTLITIDEIGRAHV